MRGHAAEPTLTERVERAVAIVAGGENLFEAYRLLHSIDPAALHRTAPGMPERYWWALGWTAYELGQYDEVESAARSLLEIARDTGNVSAQLQGLYYRASGALADSRRFSPEAAAVADMRTIVARSGPTDDLLKLLALLALGKLLAGDAARESLEQALQIAQKHSQHEYLFHIRVEQARSLARRDPQAGYDLLRQAIDSWPSADKPWSIYGWEARLEVTWAARPREEALRHSLGLLEKIEALRLRQEELGLGSMGFFSVWARAYRRVVGLILRDGGASRGDLELAFRLSERMRARVLLDELHGSGWADTKCAAEEPLRRLDALQRSISGRQRELLAGSGAEENANLLRRQIAGDMLEEEAIRREIRCGEGSVEFVELGALEETLGPEEAALIFQTGSAKDRYGAYDGGSWLLLVAPGSTMSPTVRLPIPDESIIRLKKDAFLGALRRRDGSDAAAAAALHADLFRAVEARLPAGVRHLIVIPHGPLHGLPMAALRSGEGAPPLVERFRFTYAPSATLWCRWNRREPPAGRHRVLAFADPTPAGTGRSLWRSMETSPLRPLPAARKEGRRLLQSYGNQGLLMEGVDATETVLKRASLDDVGLLLFAAHAIVDQQVPRRSAIVLAAGSPGDSSAGEDGLLQPPEISRLRLDGAIVALSGCQSAAGRAIEGEGLLSLARSFFQAGSAAVVGNLWPARDDEAGALFGALYRNLAEGLPLAAALQRAQQKLIRSGAPTEAWAGIVVLGDGDARLPSHGQVESGPGGPAAPGAPHVMAALAALAVAAGIAAVVLGVSVRRRLLRRR